MFSFGQNKAEDIRIEERYVITQLDASYNIVVLLVFFTFKEKFSVRLKNALLILNQSEARIFHHFSASIGVRSGYKVNS